MKTFYSYTEQSISWSGGWTEKRYILCETDEEYQKCLSLIEQEIEDFTKRGYASRISAKIDTEISAREYFVHGCGWTGKVFDAKGSILCKALDIATDMDARKCLDIVEDNHEWTVKQINEEL